MRVAIGKKVLYEEKEYTIIHIYTSDFCEIREEGTYKTILVHADEITVLH